MSSNNNIFRNIIAENEGHGIYLMSFSDYTDIFENEIKANYRALIIYDSSNNKIYHNNFIDNTYQVYSYNSTSVWDNSYPSGGNYWSNYAVVDTSSGFYQNEAGSDGIGDEPYEVDTLNVDNFPLMGPINYFNAGTWNEITYYVYTVSNSTVSDFYFDPDEGAFIRFDVAENEGTSGFCKVAIPRDLLWVEDGWTVLVDGLPATPTIISDEDYTYLYFTYEHSKKTVQIIGTNVIPEFQSFLILPLFIIATLLAAMLCRRRHSSDVLFS